MFGKQKRFLIFFDTKQNQNKRSLVVVLVDNSVGRADHIDNRCRPSRLIGIFKYISIFLYELKNIF